MQHLAVRGDDISPEEVVARRSVFARQLADSAAQCKAGNAYIRMAPEGNR
jgi:hypothetical protein